MTSKSVFYSFRKKFRRSSNSSSVAESNDFADNGLILSKVYLPPELIERILCSADDKTVLRCQRVCKRWNEIIKDYVWRKKAELKIGCQLSSDDSMDWRKFYVICAKIGRNLVKNHSGAEGHKYWENIRGHRFGWKIECPPIGAPKLSKDPEFKKDQHCFAGTYYDCYQQYTIDLIKEGFPAKIFDQQSPPPIEISECYSCRYDCPAFYSLKVTLVNDLDKSIDEFTFTDTMQGDRQNVWFTVKHEFKSYGPGLRKIHFTHGGIDRRYWRGNYGPKMARACVKVQSQGSIKN